MTASPQATGHPLIVRFFLRMGQIVGVLLLIAALSRVSSVVSYAWDSARMREWYVVPATVLEADYRAESDETSTRWYLPRSVAGGGCWRVTGKTRGLSQLDPCLSPLAIT